MYNCRICAARIEPFMSFGRMPIANNFVSSEDYADEYFYELKPAHREDEAQTPPDMIPDGITDTIIVPAKQEGFERVFLGENCWYSIRIGGGKLDKIKHIAAYQSRPISAITHVASVDHIEPYGDSGKYKVVFTGPAQEINHIPFGDAPSGAMQGPRYTSKARLDLATTLVDLL